MAEQWYAPGEQAPVSGVYVVVHAEHRADHEATLLEGELFPSCLKCGDKVRFRVAQPAVAIRTAGNFNTHSAK